MKKHWIICIISVLLLSLFVSCDFNITERDGTENTHTKIDEIDFVGMTYKEVKSIMGSDGEDVGSGAIIFQWELEDGRVLLVWLSGKSSDSIEDLVVTGFKLQNKSPFT